MYWNLPGIEIAAPSGAKEVKGLLTTAIKSDNPTIVLTHAFGYGAEDDVPDGDFEIPFGQADVKREGDDLSVITYGYELHRCLEAAQRLQDDEGVSVEVVDVRTIAPLDVETILASVRKTSKAMVVYEDNRSFGAGAEIAATIAEEAMFDLDAPIVRIGGPDIPAMPFAGPLEHYYVEPQPDHLYRGMLDLARS
jgi:2-oxoisovalerate dehydrogenase E1 component beta subunit